MSKGKVEFDDWSSNLMDICGHYVPHRRQKFVDGRVQRRRFDDLDVADVDGNVDRISRDRNGIRRDDAEHVFFLTQMRGTQKVEHNGYREQMQVGDSLLLDSTKEAEIIISDGGTRILSLHMPRHLFLAACDKQVEIGKRMPLSHPLASAIRRQIQQYSVHAECASRITQASSDLLINMIHLAFRKEISDGGIYGSLANTNRYELAVHLIETNLCRDELSLEWLASQMNLSVRQVQRVFEENKTTYAAMVREKRFGLVAELLRKNGHHGQVRISDAAYRAGFRDLSNFYRGFKSHFGVAPRDYLESLHEFA